MLGAGWEVGLDTQCSLANPRQHKLEVVNCEQVKYEKQAQKHRSQVVPIAEAPYLR